MEVRNDIKDSSSNRYYAEQQNFSHCYGKLDVPSENVKELPVSGIRTGCSGYKSVTCIQHNTEGLNTPINLVSHTT